MSRVDELIQTDAIVEETDHAHDDADIVVEIRWTYALVGLVVVLGIAGALAAGLWFGRSRVTARVTAQTAQTQAIQPRIVQSVPSQPVRAQPRVAPQSPSQSSSGSRSLGPSGQGSPQGGVGLSIGGAPTLGDPAPDFTLKNLEGEKVNLSDFKGQPVLINFWATWCPPCRFEMPAIQKMYDQYKEDGFVVLAVDVQESITQVQQYIDQGGYTFPVLLDYTGEISDLYRIRAFPTSYFVDPEGNIAVAHRGMMTESVLQQYMARIMATE